MTRAEYVPFALHQEIGIYPYPEFVTLFTAFFENRATKDQIDEIEKHIVATKGRRKVAKAYDYYQSLPKPEKEG